MRRDLATCSHWAPPGIAQSSSPEDLRRSARLRHPRWHRHDDLPVHRRQDAQNQLQHRRHGRRGAQHPGGRMGADMRAALPNANRMGHTGTPVYSEDGNTWVALVTTAPTRSSTTTR